MKTCECGCGRSIEGAPINTRFAPECLRLRQINRKRAERVKAAELKSVTGRFNHVLSDHTTGNPRSARVLSCQLCCDMPWARSDQRLDTSYDPIGVRAPDGAVRCRACGGAYSPECAPEPQSVLRSSAGMVRHVG